MADDLSTNIWAGDYTATIGGLWLLSQHMQMMITLPPQVAGDYINNLMTKQVVPRSHSPRKFLLNDLENL